MIVELSDKAERDLAEIGDHIALDNPLRAATFIDELQERCLTLDRHPQRFPVVGRRGRYQVRKMTYTGYVILYAVGEKRVDVLRIVHGSRDWFDLIAS